MGSGVVWRLFCRSRSDILVLILLFLVLVCFCFFLCVKNPAVMTWYRTTKLIETNVLQIQYRSLVLLPPSKLSYMLFTARCYALGYATVCRPSVCPSVCLSVTFRYRDHIGWPLHGRSGATGTPQKLGWNRGGGHSGAQKPAISPKRCKIGPRLLWRPNRKSHTRFRLVPKSTTLDDLERRIQLLPKILGIRYYPRSG